MLKKLTFDNFDIFKSEKILIEINQIDFEFHHVLKKLKPQEQLEIWKRYFYIFNINYVGNSLAGLVMT